MKEKATIFDYARMCRNFEPDCGECPMYREQSVSGLCCVDFVKVHQDKANEIILNWCKEHPVETRQDRFLKMFPNAKVRNDGVLGIEPCNVDKDKYVDADKFPCPKAHGFANCSECRKEYWLAKVDENE